MLVYKCDSCGAILDVTMARAAELNRPVVFTFNKVSVSIAARRPSDNSFPLRADLCRECVREAIAVGAASVSEATR